MHLVAREGDDLEGTGRVILRPLPTEPPWAAPGEAVRLQHGTRVCGALVEAVAPGEGIIQMDRYLRLHLQVREGQPLVVEPLACAQALAVSLIAPPAWAGPEGAPLLRGLLLGRLVSAGLKLPIFTLSGGTVTVEITSVDPPPIARISADTRLDVQTQAGRTADAAGVGYRDIGGLAREMRRIRELVEYPLRAPEVFAQLGIEAPRGIVLHGPPGTGKTLIARALSNEVGAQFYAVRGPELISAFYGESERQLRELFEKARASAPSVILIDELDSLAPRRDEARGELERRLVATLLALMDGLSELKGVVVFGTTNRINALDPALRRPGRFEHEIHIGAPDAAGRREVLAIHTRRMPLAGDVDLADLAARTPGFVGADLAALCREAGYNALRRSYPAEAFESGEISPSASVLVSAADFAAALAAIRPSAMREITVQAPRDVRWDDIGGLEEAKQLIRESVVYGLQRAEAYRAAGIRPARGLLLYGPPGTGKTLLATAAARECGANLITVRGPEIRSKWFGESEERIRFVFAKAREVAPAIIFFDEIDALAPPRGREQGGASDSVVNQLLAEMDGSMASENVFVLAATNAADLLDPALLRPGRFDLQVYVPLPDEKARQAILAIHLRHTPLAPDVDLALLARHMEGSSGADVAEVCRRAALYALREVRFEPPPGFQVTTAHLERALADVQATVKQLKPRRIGFHLPGSES